MIEYLKDYPTIFTGKLNTELMNKSADRPLVEYLVEAWKSLEVLENIKILRWEYDDNEANIDINKFMIKRSKKKKKKERVDYKFISDERYGCLTVWIRITVTDPVPSKEGHPVIHQKDITKKILVPVQDKNGYFTLKGKKYLLIYQLVDKSFYTTAQTVTLKSLMPIGIKRNAVNCEDIAGNSYSVPSYSVFIFRKEITVLLFYITNGFNWAFNYLGVSAACSLVSADSVNIDEYKQNMENGTARYLYFKLSSTVYLKVNKFMFDTYPYYKSIVGMTLSVVTNRFSMEISEDCEYWIKKLGLNNYEKGKYLRVFFARLLDETTKKTLMLDDYDKEDIYALIRWIMQNFNSLRQNDNLSLENKRLRCNEYISALLTKDFSKRLTRILALGSKATINDYTDIFNFSGDILIKAMHNSGILRFDENINDMDFYSKFRYTKKGPHSLGNHNSNNISAVQRGIHPSFLGYIDIMVSGNSDPGLSGSLTPFSNLKGLYFNDSKEPNDFIYDFKQNLVKVLEEEGVECIDIQCSDKEDYYRILDSFAKFNKENIKIYATSRQAYDIVMEKVTDSDDANDIEVEEKEIENV